MSDYAYGMKGVIMACCVFAAFIITHIYLFFRKGMNILLTPMGIQLKSDDALSGVQWSAYSAEQSEPASHLLRRDKKYLFRRLSRIRFWDKSILTLSTRAYKWAAMALVLIELGVLGGLGVHFSQHGASMAVMF